MMTQSIVSPLPLGTSSFPALRQAGEIYVDKTDLIYDLAKNRGKIFLVRPRRFGKSLLISTFESLFKHGLKDFSGLMIEKLWNDHSYDVVRLDFSEVKEFDDADDFKHRFYERLGSKFREVGFNFQKSSDEFVTQLSAWLSKRPNSSLVILIDEYDAPLTQCLGNSVLFNQIRTIMSDLFLTFKSNEGCLRFFFMTGITKFSNTSIFSAFNNLKDISWKPRYGTLLGYTAEEIRTYFAPYLEKASKSLHLSDQALMSLLTTHYDGYCFEQNARLKVFVPWSVLSFLDDPESGFKNYWYQSGGQPSVLMQYLLDHKLAHPSSYSEEKVVSFSLLEAPHQYSDMQMEALLTQAGYLTLKQVIGGDFIRLGYPNQEVATSMARLYADELLKNQNIVQSGIPLLAKILANESVDTVIEYFNKALGAIDYQRYPIGNEAQCRAYLQLLLIGAALIPRVETHNAFGRSDMEVDVGNRHWVFEFKYADNNASVSTLLKQAVKQMQTQHYGNDLRSSTVMRVVLVFSKKDRRFVAWQEVTE